MVPLDGERVPMELMRSWLSAEEIARANRFRFERDRVAFIIRRGAVRDLLAKYLNVEPPEIRLNYNEFHKPYLSGPFSQNPLRFNLSKTEGLSLVAVTQGRELGVDIEKHQKSFEIDSIVSHFYSANEIEALYFLPKSARTERFFRLWTCKEAILKAKGTGLSDDLKEFEIRILDEESDHPNRVEGAPEGLSNWSLRHFSPVPDYLAALAVEGSGYHVHLRQWSYVD